MISLQASSGKPRASHLVSCNPVNQPHSQVLWPALRKTHVGCKPTPQSLPYLVGHVPVAGTTAILGKFHDEFQGRLVHCIASGPGMPVSSTYMVRLSSHRGLDRHLGEMTVRPAPMRSILPCEEANTRN